jgi:FlaA1/EpsC-like NDP-sugar epimerase
MSTPSALGDLRNFGHFWRVTPGAPAGPQPPAARDGQGVEGPLCHRLARMMFKHRSPLLLAMHALCFAVVLPAAYLVRFDGTIPPAEWATLPVTLPAVVLVKLAVFKLLGGHRGWWRHATFPDVVKMAEVATLSTLVVLVVGFLTRIGLSTPRSVVVLDWAGTLFLLGGLRVSTRMVRERYYPMVAPQKVRPVLVLGSSEASKVLVRLIQSQPDLGLWVAGLLVEEAALVGQSFGGIKAVGTLQDLARVANRFAVGTVLVPTPAVGPREIRGLVTLGTQAGVRVQVVPGFDALLNGRVTVQPRDVDLHDLLCRTPVRIDDPAADRLLLGRVVLVTGAAGSIGSELCRQVLARRPRRLVLLDHNENGLFFLERELRASAGPAEVVPVVADITDAARVASVFGRYRPAMVFHAAAHKHVPMMETNPGEAVRNNVLDTKILVDEVVRAGVAAFVMVSTDKAVHATSVMGACKRLAEKYVQSRAAGSATRLVTVRFGNVLGSAGSVVPVFREQIRRGGPVTVTHPEMTRYFMTIPEATQLVLEAGALGRGGEIFVLDMGQPVRILDLARDMIRLSGLTEGREIEIAFTGLRPGEKLFEELYHEREEALPTPHPRIFAARHRPCEAATVEADLARLARLVHRPAAEVIAALRTAVPDYCPAPRPVVPVPADEGSWFELETIQPVSLN